MKTKIRFTLFAVMLVAAGPTRAQDLNLQERFTVLGAEYATESVDNTLPDWRTMELTASRHGLHGSSLNGTWTRAERFGLTGEQLALGASAMLGERIALTLDGTNSDDSQLFASNSLSAGLGIDLTERWTVSAGGERYQYPEVDTLHLEGGVDFAPGQWVFGVKQIHGRLKSGESGNSWVGRIGRLYGVGSQVVVAVTSGEEATRIAEDSVAVVGIRSAALSGQHWMGLNWGFSYGYGTTRQGGFYARRGANAGLLFRF